MYFYYHLINRWCCILKKQYFQNGSLRKYFKGRVFWLQFWVIVPIWWYNEVLHLFLPFFLSFLLKIFSLFLFLSLFLQLKNTKTSVYMCCSVLLCDNDTQSKRLWWRRYRSLSVYETDIDSWKIKKLKFFRRIKSNLPKEVNIRIYHKRFKQAWKERYLGTVFFRTLWYL